MSLDYERPPVIIRDWKESHRRLSQAIVFLLEQVKTGSALYGLTMTGVTLAGASPGTTLLGYGSEIEYRFLPADPATGIIQVDSDGVYRFDYTIAVTGGAINQEYILELVSSIGGNTPINSEFWGSNQQNIIVLSGSAYQAAVAGEQFNLALYSSATPTINIAGNFSVNQT
ncbi:MAG: hypothetical protein PVI97_00690 [Candidatus Thiodiazotropha sp.]|jgi:hypothetical protein